jgi:hypothetical protein
MRYFYIDKDRADRDYSVAFHYENGEIFFKITSTNELVSLLEYSEAKETLKELADTLDASKRYPLSMLRSFQKPIYRQFAVHSKMSYDAARNFF